MVSVFDSHRFVVLDLSRITCELPKVLPSTIVLKSRRGGLMVGHLRDGSGTLDKDRKEFMLKIQEHWMQEPLVQKSSVSLETLDTSDREVSLGIMIKWGECVKIIDNALGVTAKMQGRKDENKNET